MYSIESMWFSDFWVINRMEPCANWNQLPGEVLLKIFQYLDSDLDICRAAQVSKHWHGVAEDPTLREVLILDTLGSNFSKGNQFSDTANRSSPESSSSLLANDDFVGEIEESLAMLPKRCSKLVSLDVRRIPSNCIQGLLVSFINECPDLQEITFHSTLPALSNFLLCQMSHSSRIQVLTIDASLLTSDNSYEQLACCSALESVTYTAIGETNPYQFLIGLQVFFSECVSALSRITLPEDSPVSAATISNNLVELICRRYHASLVSLLMWPVRLSSAVVEALCSMPFLDNLCLFEAKFSRFTAALWEKLNTKLKSVRIFHITHSVFSPRIVDRFEAQKYSAVQEFVCESCEFDEDSSLIKFINKFDNVRNLEFYLHYGVSREVVSNIREKFRKLESLSLSDLKLPMCSDSERNLIKSVSLLGRRGLKSLSLAFIREQEEDADPATELEVIRAKLGRVLRTCELSIELDTIWISCKDINNEKLVGFCNFCINITKSWSGFVISVYT